MSRMIFNIPVGGKRSVLVSVYGAVNETVTLTSAKGEVFTAITNENGIAAALELPVGVYTVVGSVSKGALASRTVTVDKNTTVVTAYPDGAIYWYGVFADGVSYKLFNIAGGAKPELQTNRIFIQPGQGYSGGIAFEPAIKRVNYTALKGCIDWNPQNSSWFACNIGLSTTNTEDPSGAGVTFVVKATGESGVTDYSCDISSVDADTAYYIKLRQNGNEFYVNAVWLE